MYTNQYLIKVIAENDAAEVKAVMTWARQTLSSKALLNLLKQDEPKKYGFQNYLESIGREWIFRKIQNNAVTSALKSANAEIIESLADAISEKMQPQHTKALLVSVFRDYEIEQMLRDEAKLAENTGIFKLIPILEFLLKGISHEAIDSDRGSNCLLSTYKNLCKVNPAKPSELFTKLSAAIKGKDARQVISILPEVGEMYKTPEELLKFFSGRENGASALPLISLAFTEVLESSQSIPVEQEPESELDLLPAINPANLSGDPMREVVIDNRAAAVLMALQEFAADKFDSQQYLRFVQPSVGLASMALGLASLGVCCVAMMSYDLAFLQRATKPFLEKNPSPTQVWEYMGIFRKDYYAMAYLDDADMYFGIRENLPDSVHDMKAKIHLMLDIAFQTLEHPELSDEDYLSIFDPDTNYFSSMLRASLLWGMGAEFLEKFFAVAEKKIDAGVLDAGQLLNFIYAARVLEHVIVEADDKAMVCVLQAAKRLFEKDHLHHEVYTAFFLDVGSRVQESKAHARTSTQAPTVNMFTSSLAIISAPIAQAGSAGPSSAAAGSSRAEAPSPS